MACHVLQGFIDSVLTSTQFLLLMLKSLQMSLLSSSLLSGSMFLTTNDTIVCSGVDCTRFSVTVFIFSEISFADAFAFINSIKIFPYLVFLTPVVFLRASIDLKLSVGFDTFFSTFDLDKYCFRSITNSLLIFHFSAVPFGLVLIFFDFF